MNIKTFKTKIFREKEKIIPFIIDVIPHIPERAIMVITSKIVALGEGRVAPLEGRKEKEALIRRESEFAFKTKYVWLTVKDGAVMANAGIDESNADGKIVLLPRDSYKAAAIIRKALIRQYKVKELGVLITDSRLLPFRAGIAGVALGYAGFRGVRDYRGEPDIFGRKLKMTRTDIADSLAAATVLEMGEGKERRPLGLITGASIEFTDRINRKELSIDPREDMYGPLFGRLRRKK